MSSWKKESFIADRFTQGVIAGVVGWFPQFIFMYLMHWAHWSKFRYVDFAALITYNHRPQGIVQMLFSELIVILVASVLGAVFAMLIKAIHSPALLFKGSLYGAISWFLIYVAFALFKVEGIYGKPDFLTVFLNLAGVFIWGLSMSWALQIINRRFGVEN